MTIKHKKPTIYDVAKLAGVSQTTVSFILSGRSNSNDRISDETRERVKQAISTLGYVPNQAARSLRKQRTERIALVIDRLGAPYFEFLVQDLQVRAEKHGYSLILLMGKTSDQIRRIMQTLQQGLVEGVFFSHLVNIESNELVRLAQSGMAVVAYHNTMVAEGVDFVRNPGYQSTREAVRHLVTKGHRRIAFIGFISPIGLPDNRLQGYMDSMQELGLEPHINMVNFDDWLVRERIYEHATTVLNHTEQPTAIICASDLAAICVIAAAYDRGLRIPEDLAVIGFGNIPEARIVRPAITTFGPDPLDFSPAIDMLFSRLEGKAPPESRVWFMDWKFIERNTT